MSMKAEAEDLVPSSRPAHVAEPSIISGIRPAPPELGQNLAVERPGSPWAPVAAVAWLLALTPAAVDAVRASFAVALTIAMLQAALIAGVLMRPAWTRRLHLLLIGVGALFSLLLLTMISFDRSEYRIDLERFETTAFGPATASD